MIPVLRPYQELTNSELHSAVAKGETKIILCLPTGGGKTTIAASLIFEMLEQKKTVLFLAHRRELIDNASDRLRLYGIRPGVIQAGRRSVIAPVQVASIQTLGKRIPPHADIVFVDECHHSSSPTWKKLIYHYSESGSVVIGLTATPYRTDGKGLGDLYDELICPVTMKDLIGDGYLVPARFYGPAFDVSDLKVSGGDYDQKAMAAKFDKRERYDDLLDNYKRFADGKKTIIFNPNVKISLQVVQTFTDAGYKAGHVDGEMNSVQRMETIDAFRRGDLDILSNVNILTEGVDIPSIECGILNRATISKSLYFQMVGRVLRPFGAKRHAIIIDQGGNFRAFGDPADDGVPALKETVKKKKRMVGASPVKECPKCYLLQHLSAVTCAECGHDFMAGKKLKKAVFVDMEEHIAMATSSGQLAKVLAKPWDSLTMEEMEMVRHHKGYKSGWVVRQLKAQSADLPEIQEEIFHQLVATYASLKGYDPKWVDYQLKMYA
jgi:DNA repair protein RadD